MFKKIILSFMICVSMLCNSLPVSADTSVQLLDNINSLEMTRTLGHDLYAKTLPNTKSKIIDAVIQTEKNYNCGQVPDSTNSYEEPVYKEENSSYEETPVTEQPHEEECKDCSNNSVEENYQEPEQKEVEIEQTVCEPKILYTSTIVNFRADASTDSEIIEILAAARQVMVTATKGNFSYCTVGDKTGYIANEYLQEQNYTDADLRLVSSIIWAEAGNQCIAGMQAVGIVVMNRVQSDLFPNSVSEVIYQPNQFSPTLNGAYTKALLKYDNKTIPDEVIAAARYALSGNKTVYYNNRTYDMSSYLYFSRYRVDCRLQIQDHQFS